MLELARVDRGRRWLAGVVVGVLVLGAAACAPGLPELPELPVPSLLRRDRGLSDDAAERLAGTVTIHRDQWGVPHIYGPTDASVAFGVGYAQAEDNFWQLEDDHIHAIGRAAEVYGEEKLPWDLLRRALRVEQLSRAEYRRSTERERAIFDAYAAGINYYLRRHPEVQPRLLRRFEPWQPLAIFREVSPGMRVSGMRLGEAFEKMTGIAARPEPGEPEYYLARVADGDSPIGSNAWAIAPSRTASGHALLFINPHVGFFGMDQRWEVHVHSDEGWHFSGFAVLGTPIPRSGHNEALGWTHTNSGADEGDAYIEAFDDPARPLAYRYGDGWREATEWVEKVRVKVGDAVETRRFTLRATHHGPVVAYRDGKPVTVRIARLEEGGNLQQWYAMNRARNLAEFRAALARATFPISNTVYADRVGNIWFLNGNAVPRRDPAFDWSKPVDGSDSRTEWQGYHTIDELPQVLNPACGWVQNTNSTPYLTSGPGDNPSPDSFPAYMSRHGDNARSRISRRLLASHDLWTLEDWARAAFDTRVIEAEEDLPALIDEWERLPASEASRAARVQAAIDALRTWDRVSTIESPAMTLYTLWHGVARRKVAEGAEWPLVAALESVVEQLERDWGTSLVPWGEINRLQRVHTSGREPFSDDRPSLPVAGGPGSVGIVFNFYTRQLEGAKRRYGVMGHSYVSVVEFGAQPTAFSIMPFGQGADPESPHYFDQAPLYAAGRFKPAWFTREEVEANAVSVYHPGEEAGATR